MLRSRELEIFKSQSRILYLDSATLLENQKGSKTRMIA